MPKRYNDDDYGPPSPSSASSSSTDGDSDDEDDRPKESARQPNAGSSISPVVWMGMGVAIAVVAGLLWWILAGRDSAGGASSAASAGGEGAGATTAATNGASGGGGQASPSKAASDTTNSAAAPSSSSSSSPSSSSSSSGNLPPLVGTDLLVDFSTYTSASGDLSTFLSKNGLHISDYPVGSEPVTHTFVPENVDFDEGEGAIRLKVDGQSSGKEDVKSGEIATTSEILYGTVTTRAKASPVEGVCHGFFYYADDNHEVDIELLSSFYTQGKGDAVAAGVEFTNQPLEQGGKETNKAMPYGFDPTADYHDYTIEWTSTATTFYIDGKLFTSLEENVPTTPMNMIWNSADKLTGRQWNRWSSGGPNWSAGPPTEDSYLLIQGLAANWTTVEGSGGKGEERE
ncbi:hypothetical protein JCM11641_003526 [Rhodosporidiobolus odoratus]